MQIVPKRVFYVHFTMKRVNFSDNKSSCYATICANFSTISGAVIITKNYKQPTIRAVPALRAVWALRARALAAEGCCSPTGWLGLAAEGCAALASFASCAVTIKPA